MLEGNTGWTSDTRRAIESFKVVLRWAKANSTGPKQAVKDVKEVHTLLEVVDLSKAPPEFLKETVKPSQLVDFNRLWEIVSHQQGLHVATMDAFTYTKLRTFGSCGSGPAQFADIGMVAVHGHGQGNEQLLAVADELNRRVLIFNVESSACVECTYMHGEPLQPSGVAFNHRGELIVSDFANDRICIFTHQGAYLRSFGKQGSGYGEISGPLGVAVTRQGDIVLCDQLNHRVQIYRDDGTFLYQFGAEGTGTGQFNHPTGVCVTSEGSIVVADCYNSRLQVFNMLGSHITTISSAEEGLAQLVEPYAVTAGTCGEILVTSYARDGVQVFSKDGVFLRSVGVDPGGNVDIRAPKGLAVDSQGRIFVANQPESGCHVVMLAATL